MTDYKSKKPFDLVIPVRAEDIDQLNHVNNLVYVRWIQDVAVAHWEKYASESHKTSFGWVVIRHEIDYKYSARINDTVVVRTWVGTANKNIFERHTEIFRQSDMKTLIKARSLWCPIDIKTLRPIRAGADVYEQWSVNDIK